MKLINRIILFMSVAILLTLTIWAYVFYVNMLDEVHDSIDDGLENSKMLIIRKAGKDSSIFEQRNFDERNYAIREISRDEAVASVEEYKDTLMYMENEAEMEPVRILTSTFQAEDGRFYRLKVISSMVEEDDLIEDLFYALLWLYIILVVTILTINLLVLRAVLKPFYAFLQRLRQFKLGKQETVAPIHSTVSEFQYLNQVVQEVLERNVRSYRDQKQLIENVSHEIQTPVAIAMSKLQFVLENPDLDETTATDVVQAIDALERLKRMNKSLLLLSKIENNQFAGVEELDFTRLVETILSEFEDQIEFKGIRVHWLEKEPVQIQVEPELARILVTNLIKNAIRHNYKKGEIKLKLSEEGFQVWNTGKEQALDPERLFTRFYNDSENPHSTGLGLAIARSVALVSGFTLEYRFEETGHTFNLRFR